MGLMDKARPTELPRQAAATCGNHFFAEVNKGGLNVQRWTAHLNEMHGKGYRLSHVFEQDGNTVQVFEHYPH